MTVTINGTTGIANDGGYTGDGVVFADTTPANTLVTTTGGNVGIGTSSPATRLDVNVSGANGINLVTASSVDSPRLFFTGSGGGGTACVINNADGSLRFGTGATAGASSGTERARIDPSGNLLVGTTSSGAYTARTTLSTNAGTTKWDLGPYSTATNFIVSNGTGGVVLVGSATSWSAVSDERLKTELKPIENAAAKVASLRAGTGRYLTDDESVSRVFLIAQDVQAVLPEAVDVSEDEQQTLMLRYTDTVPLLVAAIQEQQALIASQSEIINAQQTQISDQLAALTALTARVTALENQP